MSGSSVSAENCVSGAEDIGQKPVLEYTLCQRKEGMWREKGMNRPGVSDPKKCTHQP